MYNDVMTPESAKKLQAANEAAVALLTLLTVDSNDEAIKLVADDDIYTSKIVSIVLATYASCGVKLLGKLIDSDPLDLVQALALSAATYTLEIDED